MTTLSLMTALARPFALRAVWVVALLVGAGLLEGIGILSLLPLLSTLTGNEGSSSSIATAIFDVLGRFGIAPTVGALISVAILGLVFKGVLQLVAVSKAGYIGADLAMKLRADLISSLVGARWEHFSAQPVGTVANAVSSEANRVTQLAVQTCYLIAAVVQIVIYLVLALAVSFYVTVFALAVGVILFAGLNFLVRMAREAGQQETSVLRSLARRLADGIASIKPLKAMGREGFLSDLLKEESVDLNHAQRRQAVSRAALPAAQEPLVALVVGVGAYVLVRRVGLGFESLVFMALLFQRIISRLGNAQAFYQSVGALQSAYESITSLITEAAAAREVHTGRVQPRLTRAIELRDVGFSYGSRTVLRDVNLSIPRGSLVAVVGPSGVGKTTLADLVTGLLVPDQGTILIDDVALTDVDLGSWRRRIGYVPQEMILLHESIHANIVMGDGSITLDDIENALRAAEAWEFTSALPEGIWTPVGERGIRLSGGQRQRISLARALVRKPDLLILDEATAALDPETELDVMRTLSNLKPDVTMLMISHQMAVADVADEVFRLTPQP